MLGTDEKKAIEEAIRQTLEQLEPVEELTD